MAKNISLILFLFLSFLFIGCSEKEIKVVPKYIKTPCHYPKLKTYPDLKTLNLSIKPEGNNVCVKEWKACIPKNEFMNLVRYINYKKEIIKKYESEINTYNKTYIKENK